MIKTLLLIFAPVQTWDGIFRAQRSVVFVLAVYLLPLMVISSVVEGYGLVHWGKWQGEVPHLVYLKAGEAAVFEAMQFMLSLALVIVNSGMIKSTSSTFQPRHTYAQGFKTVAYGMGPLFLFRMLNAFKDVSPWVGWLVGILLTCSVLYHGVPKIMLPDPAHAFGLYVVTCLLLLFTTGLMHMLTAFTLQGDFPKVMTVISGLGEKLPF